MQETDELAERAYLIPWDERLRRHLRRYLSRSVLAGISGVAVVAGFLSAAQITWSLPVYLLLTAGATAVCLPGFALLEPARRHVLVGSVLRRRRAVPSSPGAPPALAPLIAAPNAPNAPNAPTAQIRATACHDPVYSAGLRVLLPPNRPLIIVPSGLADVSRPEELVLPVFSHRLNRSHLRVDMRQFGIPIAPYVVERLPGTSGGKDDQRPVRELSFVTRLAAALVAGSGGAVPQLVPEHCVDPARIAENDVVVVGGPEHNIWHALLFEPVHQEFAFPASSVPLAFSMRQERDGGIPVYTNTLHSVLADGGRQHTAAGSFLNQATCGMMLACRNPLAAAVGRSRWCVFVAGSTSLGTAGALLALSHLLQRLARSADANHATAVPTVHEQIHAQVSAALSRVVEVEQAWVRSDGQVIPRQRRRLPVEGPVPVEFQDSWIPTRCELLTQDEDGPRWAPA